MKLGTVVPLDDAWVLAELGPMRLEIAAWHGDSPFLEPALQGGEWACALLEELAGYQQIVKRKNPWPAADEALPAVVRRMIASVESLGDRDLTPLATVAGTIADLVAEHIFAQGLSKVIVNNGGDIAIRMLPDQTIKVGVRPDVSSPEMSHFVALQGKMGIGGVTTSGVGGRSFTKGVASAVVVLAPTASAADAASTSLANATRIRSPRVQMVAASKLYPDTDLSEELVTSCVGPLTGPELDEALANGMARARQYIARGVIRGAIICVQGRTGWTEGIGNIVFPIMPE